MEPLKSKGQGPILSVDFMKDVNSVSSLKTARMKRQEELQNVIEEIPLLDWYQLVNELHDAVAQKAIELTEGQMLEDGFGHPPVSYAFIVFGSSGRGEATLWSDQDNGMIISDEDHPEKEWFFTEFGIRLSNMLESVGYAKCEGKVMCSEPLWRRTISSWTLQLSEWADDLKWEPVRYLIIAADMRHVSGEDALSERFREYFSYLFESVPDLAAAVLRNTVKHKATLNILGQVVKERFGEHAGGFDVKYGMYIPLVNSGRYLALQHGLKETNTMNRLNKLARLEAAPSHLIEQCEDAFLIALRLRRSTQVKDDQGILSSSGYIDEDQLRQRNTMYELREGLSAVKKVHRNLQRQLRFVERRRT
ncbi:DUF294 nucleotidyltransferase-like domain-containing protein [Paenibacillus sp. Marseille-Q4541]|uniref:DUF294 nucleotidyltransferase-like domain-containing protein n=1 Tax=Paenibacillus sp. Marseille-Q4541 TaxID=2831522 RepID=UPI002019DDD4|nr:DUF294 nucleotidyltransferase-like domain-containing protein [Paenibacillus sp. Marseille-Q4541]